MIKQLEDIRKTRAAILDLISDMTPDELNKVPKGFSNNIIWNMAHLVAAQDNIFYVKAGHPLKNISQEYFNTYKPGSKPEKDISAEEVEGIKLLLFSSVEQLEQDFKLGIFEDYTPWTTRYGFDIASANDGLTLLPFHDGLHFGYMMALRRVLIGMRS